MESSSDTWDGTFDVIVAGSGAAAGGAVMGALMNGAEKILVCEKSTSFFGGTTAKAGLGWMWIPNNRFLRELGIKQPANEIKELLMSVVKQAKDGYTIDAVDEQLIESFATHWPSTMDELESRGFFKLSTQSVRSDEDAEMLKQLYLRKFEKHGEKMKAQGITKDAIEKLCRFMPSYCAENDHDLCPSGKVISTDGSSTSALIKKMISDNQDKITLKMGFKVLDLIFLDPKKKSNVIGAIVKDMKTGKTFKFAAKKGVFFGTGGFSHNQELLKESFPKVEFHGSCAGDENVGDLVRIAKKNGIKLHGMDEAWLKQVVVPEHSDRFPGVFFHNADSFLVVDRTGKRFANERDFYQERGRQMTMNQKDRKVVVAVFDERSSEIHAGALMSLGGPIPFEDCTEDCTVYGNTFKELAKNLQVLINKHVQNYELEEDFAAQLQKQVMDFNEFAKSGVDLEFGREKEAAKICWQTPRRQNECPSKTMHPINVLKLRAMILGLSTLDTRGGPRTNADGQIFKDCERKDLVKGLYGSGNCVKSFAGQSYPASGITIASAMFFGVQSGKHMMTSASTFPSASSSDINSATTNISSRL